MPSARLWMLTIAGTCQLLAACVVVPDGLDVPGGPSSPGVSGAPGVPGVPGAPGVPGVPGALGPTAGPGAAAPSPGEPGATPRPSATPRATGNASSSAWDTSKGVQVAHVAGTVSAVQFVDGPADKAVFHEASDLVADASGTLYVADTGNYVVRAMGADKQVQVLAGLVERPEVVPPGHDVWDAETVTYKDGPRLSAVFDEPRRLATDATGNVFVSDGARIRVINRKSGNVTTVLGNGQSAYAEGAFDTARIEKVGGLAIDKAGNLYFSEVYRGIIRKVDLSDPRNPVSSVFAGAAGQKGSTDGDVQAARFTGPGWLAFDGRGTLYVLDGHKLRKIVPDGAGGGEVSTVAGDGLEAPKFNVVVGKQAVPDTFDRQGGTTANLGGAWALAVDPSGIAYVRTHYNLWGCTGDCFDSDHFQIRQIKPDGTVRTILNCDDVDGTKRYAFAPTAMRASADGRLLMLADGRIWMVQPKP